MEPKIPVHLEHPVSHPTAPSNHEQPVAVKPKLSKWIIVAIGIACLLLVGGGLLSIQKKSAPTGTQNTPVVTVPTVTSAAQWKTYTNTKYNYSIDYPSNWEVREYPETKDGAAFNPFNKPGYPDSSDAITISAGQKVGTMDDPFKDYVKTAASGEIQNFNKIASLKKITTTDGIVGYETTWMVQPMTVMGRPPTEGESESLPITYFEAPNSKTLLLRVYLNRKEDMNTYEKMLKTLKNITPLNATPTPTVDEAAVLKNVIKKYIALKHKSDEDSLTFSVSKIEGNFAQGGVSDEGGGGMWFAAKEDGVWKLVWDGNGVILCTDLINYPDFSKSMIPECYDEAKQDTIQR